MNTSALAMPHQQKLAPTPEAFASADAYRHNPYGQHGSLLFYFGDQQQQQQAAGWSKPPAGLPSDQPLPNGTLHRSLRGRVTFVPYPADEFVLPGDARHPVAEAPGAGAALERVFMGQLPYFVTEMQLAWLVYTFGHGHVVGATQRIVKRQPRGTDGVERLPTGCVHAMCAAGAVDDMAAGMHKRLLVDDTGVWWAATPTEHAALKAHVAMLKRDRRKRVAGRPYDTVVVQRAESDYVPTRPVWISDAPRAVEAPPAYGDAVAALSASAAPTPLPPAMHHPADEPEVLCDDGMGAWRC